MAWPTTDEPRDCYTTLRMTQTETAETVSAAAALGMSKSEFIRAAIEEKNARVKKAAKRKQSA